jgi:hypothetical protein
LIRPAGIWSNEARMNITKKNIPLLFVTVFVLAMIGLAAFLVITHAKTSALPQQPIELGKFDPKLLIYEQIGEGIATGFKEPQGLCVDQAGRLIVIGDQAIRVFDAEGKFLRQVDLPAKPRCISQAGSGTIYVGMTDYIVVMDAALNKVATWDTLGDKSVISSIAAGANDVFVADAGRRVIHRYDLAGRLIGTIGQRPAGAPPIFVIPSPYFDIAIAQDGLLRVAETGRHLVETYTFDGDRKSAWGRFGTDIAGFTGCCNPVSFAMLPDGGFVTAEKGLTRVKIYDPAGKFVGVVAGPASFARHDTICAANGGNCQTGGLDVAVDKPGRIFVMDPYTADVRIFVRKPTATQATTGQATKDNP